MIQELVLLIFFSSSIWLEFKPRLKSQIYAFFLFLFWFERWFINLIIAFYFAGLVVNLACRGDYNVFPNQVKCRRKSPTEPTLEWSHKPVCYPSVLVSKTHWTKALHVRSVSCTGDSTKTSCSLSCIRDYVAVESSPYECTVPVCPAWTLGRDCSRFFVHVGHEKPHIAQFV